MEFPSGNNKERMPYEHYMKLYRALDPQEAAARTGLEFSDGAFVIPLMRRRYRASFPGYEVVALEPDAVAGTVLVDSVHTKILMLRYLTGGSLLSSKGEYLAYRDMPWGETYAQNFHGRCILRLARGFGYSPESFERGMERLGALRAAGGDAAFVLELLPGLNMKFIMWYGDDEFPPSAQILFSDNFPAAFSAEDMAYAGDVTLDALKIASK